MIARNHIRHPLEWTWDHIKLTTAGLASSMHSIRGADEVRDAAALAVRQIAIADLRLALRNGWRDFTTYRSDVIFLCVIYPILGLLLARQAVGTGMLPLIFPLLSGFALIGPVAAAGLYEMSRRRERGADVSWSDAFGVALAASLGPMIVLGLILAAIFLLWLLAADTIYAATMGPQQPASIAGFVEDVFTAGTGWAMIVIGMAVGFVFALLVLTISVVSFPLLLDRDVGIYTALLTSVSVVKSNPGPMAVWGLIVAAGLVVDTIPFLLGLAIVLPVLGHATWHLYRRVVVA